MADTRLLLGAVTGARGLKGEVKIKSFTEDPKAVASYGPVMGKDPATTYDIKVVGQSKGVVIARIAGISDRNAAEALKGERFYISRDLLPDADAEEFYHADLIGLAARLEDGTELGKITALYDFGAGDMLEVKAKGRETHVIPFTKAAVPVVDIAAGHVLVAELPGLFEDPEPEADK